MFNDGIGKRKNDIVFEEWTKELKNELTQFWIDFTN